MIELHPIPTNPLIREHAAAHSHLFQADAYERGKLVRKGTRVRVTYHDGGSTSAAFVINRRGEQGKARRRLRRMKPAGVSLKTWIREGAA